MKRTTLLLISLIWCVQSEGHLNDDTPPVHLLDQHHIVIDGYHGHMNAKTLELFGNVKTLVFQNCNFTSFNENYKHSLTNLQKLVFVNSHFDRVKSDVSTCCKNLHELRVIGCSIGDVDEDIFKKWSSFKSLDGFYLLRMHVPVLYSNAFAGSNFKKIEIIDSNLATIQDGAFNGMEKLEILDLQRNKLKTIPTDSLAALKTLKKLNLEKNLLEKITTADFPSLPNLEELHLGHNPVKEIDLKGLKEKLPNIKKVEVSGINIDPSKAEGIPLLAKEVA